MERLGASERGLPPPVRADILTNLGTFERGSPEFMAEAFLKTVGGDPEALLRVLDTFVDTPLEVIGHIEIPTLVLSGIDDRDNGRRTAIAGNLVSITQIGWTMTADRHLGVGNHMSLGVGHNMRVTTRREPDRELERLLAQQNRGIGTKPILEINLRHPLVTAISKAGDDAADLSFLLLEQAQILDGELPDDPAAFASRLNRLVIRS